jgi:hypothetical protein
MSLDTACTQPQSSRGNTHDHYCDRLLLFAPPHLRPLHPTSSLPPQFREWKVMYNKTYATPAVESERLRIFAENVAMVARHNALASAGQYTFKLAANQFADLTNDEYRATYLGLKRRHNRESRPAPSAIRQSADFTRGVAAVPNAWDWRDHGYTIPVKDQGSCGSCWSFSATAAMEGAHFLATGQLVSLSEQLCVDCVFGGNDTCAIGGEMHDCYLQVIQEGGDESEDAYPYIADDEPCRFDKSKVVATFSSYKNVTQFDEIALQNATAATVISVAIDASSMWFQLYATRSRPSLTLFFLSFFFSSSFLLFRILAIASQPCSVSQTD